MTGALGAYIKKYVGRRTVNTNFPACSEIQFWKQGRLAGVEVLERKRVNWDKKDKFGGRKRKNGKNGMERI